MLTWSYFHNNMKLQLHCDTYRKFLLTLKLKQKWQVVLCKILCFVSVGSSNMETITGKTLTWLPDERQTASWQGMGSTHDEGGIPGTEGNCGVEPAQNPARKPVDWVLLLFSVQQLLLRLHGGDLESLCFQQSVADRRIFLWLGENKTKKL